MFTTKKIGVPSFSRRTRRKIYLSIDSACMVAVPESGKISRLIWLVQLELVTDKQTNLKFTLVMRKKKSTPCKVKSIILKVIRNLLMILAEKAISIIHVGNSSRSDGFKMVLIYHVRGVRNISTKFAKNQFSHQCEGSRFRIGHLFELFSGFMHTIGKARNNICFFIRHRLNYQWLSCAHRCPFFCLK